VTYPIEKGIPVPDQNENHRKPHRFPIRDMMPGDSFLIPEKAMTAHVRQAVRNTANYYGKHIVTHKVPGGLRVWTVAKKPAAAAGKKAGSTPRRAIPDHRQTLSLAECERIYGLRHGTAGKAVRAGVIKGRARGTRIIVSAKRAAELWGAP